MLLLRVGIEDFGGAQSWATMVGPILRIKVKRRTARTVMNMRKPPGYAFRRTELTLPVTRGEIIKLVRFRSTANEAHRARRRDKSRIVDEVTRFLFHYHAFYEIDDF